MTSRHGRHRRSRWVFGGLVAVVVGVVLGAALMTSAPASAAPRSVDDAASGTGMEQVHYTGQWATGAESRFFDGSEHYSASAGARAVMRFHGSQLVLRGGVGKGGGIASISVDGGPAYEVDFHETADRGDVRLWVSPFLQRGDHRVVLQVTGQHRNDSTGSFVALDRFQLIDGGRVVAANDRSFRFSGAWRVDGDATLRSSSGSVALRFTGAAAIVRGHGRVVSASVDGGPVDPARTRRGVLLASGPLKPGGHVLRLRFASGPAVVEGADTVRGVVFLPERLAATGTSAGWRTQVENPVLGKNWGTAFDLSAIYDSGVYRMWFSWRPQGSIAYVESVDGVSWTVPRTVLAAVPGTWQSIVNRPSVLRGPDGRYHMWYTGQRDDSSAIGVAVSANGLDWQRHDEPVLTPRERWEEPSVMNPSVLWDSKTKQYRMWFSGGATWEPNAIGLATSSDGQHFTRSTKMPVLERDPDHRWESDRVAGIQVLATRTGYRAFYIGYADIDTAAIGTARSADGVHWTDRAARSIVAAVPGQWNCDAVYKPFALHVAARDEWRLWFNGRCGAPEQIGMAIHHGDLPE